MSDLVEAWGVRADDGVMEHYYSRDHAERHEDPSTVVPLIAADRLTDEALVEVLAATLFEGEKQMHRKNFDTLFPEVKEFWYIQARTHLAALRAHLERP